MRTPVNSQSEVIALFRFSSNNTSYVSDIREKELLNARSELLELQRENEILNDNVSVLSDNKDATIKSVLKKLHNADDNLQNSILDVQKVVLEKTKALNDKNRKRTEASDELNSQLCSELERNKNLEADIVRWTFYRQQGSKFPPLGGTTLDYTFCHWLTHIRV